MASEVPRESGPVAKVRNAVNKDTQALMPHHAGCGRVRAQASWLSSSRVALGEQGRVHFHWSWPPLACRRAGWQETFCTRKLSCPGLVRNDALANRGCGGCSVAALHKVRAWSMAASRG